MLHTAELNPKEESRKGESGWGTRFFEHLLLLVRNEATTVVGIWLCHL